MNYTITNESIYLPTKDSGKLRLTITDNSGRIVYRNKIDTIIGIKHPGIELGIDQYGNRWIAHHHYENNVPAIESEQVFSMMTAQSFITRLKL